MFYRQAAGLPLPASFLGKANVVTTHPPSPFSEILNITPLIFSPVRLHAALFKPLPQATHLPSREGHAG